MLSFGPTINVLATLIKGRGVSELQFVPCLWCWLSPESDLCTWPLENSCQSKARLLCKEWWKNTCTGSSSEENEIELQQSVSPRNITKLMKIKQYWWINKSSVLLPKSHSFQGSYSKIFLFFSDSYNKVPYRKLKKDEYGLYVLELDPITKG